MKRIRVALYICLMPIATCLWSQNVGIGVASPAGKLHIKGTSDISQLIIEANGTQSTMAPLIKLKNSLGNDLLWIHSDDTSNVFLGLHAGRVNSINNGGAYNTFLGSNAGKSNISGPFNTANGAGALFSNTSGANNTTIGSVSLFSNISGSNNTASGTYSLSSNTTGSDNTSSGYGSLFSNLSGDYNTAIGSSALTFNTIGMWNTGIGSNALYFNVEGNANVALGNAALLNNTYGSSNTANGTDALFSNTIGSSNTAIGYRTLYNNTIGLHNTAIGHEALQSNVSGNKNTAIGYKADAANDIINATAIGSNAYAGGSNSVVIGSINGVNGATANANVGIGTTTPNAKLHVSGTVKISDGTQGAGKLLTSDATGQASWQPPPPPPGTSEPSVSICCQRWMSKNLDVAVYRNGDAIPKVTNDAEWAALTTGAYCYYNNDSTTYAATYGKLYNWYAVNDPRGLAPEGWYIPSDFEWTTLSSCLGGDDLAGGLMKEIGTTHWSSPNAGATNLSGFTGLPGGSRDNDGPFYYLNTNGGWWSSIEIGPASAWVRELVNVNDNLARGTSNKHRGASVRCLRD